MRNGTEDVQQYVGRTFEYLTHSGKKRTATVQKVEFHPLLKEYVFVSISPYGNDVQLTMSEIHRFI